MNDYLVWVDTSTKIASFHEVEASDLLHFEQYENFMNYLASLTAQGDDRRRCCTRGSRTSSASASPISSSIF